MEFTTESTTESMTEWTMPLLQFFYGITVSLPLLHFQGWVSFRRGGCNGAAPLF